MPAICFLTGSCWLFILFAKDITHDLNLLEFKGKLKRNCAESKRRFCKIVRAYSDVKELSVEMMVSKMKWSSYTKKLFILFVFCAGLLTSLTSFMNLKLSSFSFGHYPVFAPLLLYLMLN